MAWYEIERALYAKKKGGKMSAFTFFRCSECGELYELSCIAGKQSTGPICYYCIRDAEQYAEEPDGSPFWRAVHRKIKEFERMMK